jgi:fructose-bisphosphate aldolase class 1
MDEAVIHCTEGIGIWQWASNDQGTEPDVVMACCGDSTATCNKRFGALGIPQTVENRRAYRELIITTPGLNEFISGLILYDETIHQQDTDGTFFVKIIRNEGIIPGIKVDTGTQGLGFPLPVPSRNRR